MNLTVKDVVALLHEPKSVKLAWGGHAYNLDIHDDFIMEAYGDFIVRDLCTSFGPDSYELDIIGKPIKKGAANA